MSTEKANALANEILAAMRGMSPEIAEALMLSRKDDINYINYINAHEPVRVIHMRNLIGYMQAREQD